MKRLTLLLVALVVLSSVNAWAVGELLGLTVALTLDDGQAWAGVVVQEDDSTLTLDVAGQTIEVQRAALQTISLIRHQAGLGTVQSTEIVFYEAKRQALKHVAWWRLGRDGVETFQAVLISMYAWSQPAERLDLVLGYLGAGLAGFVWDVVFRPDQEARLLWEARLPFWHGLASLASGFGSLGGAISLALGFVVPEMNLSNLGTAQEWFERAATLYLVEAGGHTAHIVYDVGVLLAP